MSSPWLSSAKMSPSPTRTSILIIDDDPLITDLIEVSLEQEGYNVLVASSGSEGIEAAEANQPRLILLDVMLPDMDGMAVCRALRAAPNTTSIPIIMLSALSSSKHRVAGLDDGADDYIAKPFHLPELLARIRTQFRHATNSYLSELTGLPGNTLITHTIRTELEAGGEDLSILYIDLDDFKAYNDHEAYGFLAGNEMIKLTASVIQRAVALHSNAHNFCGHIGGDDFVVVTRAQDIEALCMDMIALFNRERGVLYRDEDRRRGSIVSVDRQGRQCVVGLAALSIGVVSTSHRAVSDEWEVSRIAAEVKKKAKSLPGSAYYMDQRGNF